MSNWNILDRWSPYALAALRIVAALIFILRTRSSSASRRRPSGTPPLLSLFGSEA